MCKILRELNTPANKRPELLAKHSCRYRFFQKFKFFLVFLENSVSINPSFCTVTNLLEQLLHQIKYHLKIAAARTSFISPFYLRNSSFRYGVKLLRCGYLFHNFYKHGVHWNCGKSLQSINWLKSIRLSCLIKLTQIRNLVKLF